MRSQGLGRVKKRSIDGSANEVSAVFDDTGRVTSVINNLGTFDYAYVAETARLDHVDLPNGQKTQFDYYDNSGDQRLKEIKHLAPNHTDVISQHNYTYNSYGQITQWVQDNDSLTDPKRYNFGYDNTDRLVAATLKNDTSGAIEKRYSWGYDQAGNRVSEQVDNGTGVDTALQTSTANNLNQLTGLAPSGATVFRGTLDEPGTVTVEGNPAKMAPGGTAFEGWANLTTGPNTVTIAATDENANTTTNQYTVDVAGGSSRTLTYDDNGNLLSDGLRTYEWDAKNRLLAIEKTGDWRTEFTYNGLDRRVKLKDIDISGSPSTTREVALLWDGLAIQEERNAAGSSVQKRYFGSGMEITGGPSTGEYLYLRDHLGSIREMTDNDSSAVLRARYDFDLWGERSANLISTGAAEADFAFTGHFFHPQSGLILAPYRAFDPETGRWISRDWIGELDGANEYIYCGNSPLSFVDLTGFLKLPNDPTGLPPEWAPDPKHRYPHGDRFRHPGGDILDFHWPQPGKPGWGGKPHWHHNGGKEHLPPGTDIPDPVPPPIVPAPGSAPLSCPDLPGVPVLPTVPVSPTVPASPAGPPNWLLPALGIGTLGVGAGILIFGTGGLGPLLLILLGTEMAVN